MIYSFIEWYNSLGDWMILFLVCIGLFIFLIGMTIYTMIAKKKNEKE
jgi:hypothetical protein